MLVIEARNVNDAWTKAKRLIASNHIVRNSRVGEVWEAPEPVTTVYRKPWERVLFDVTRNANPFFHLMEGLWMLAGRNDVAWISQFNDRMKEFSDDKEIFHGAYGYRWRSHFETYRLFGQSAQILDQLPIIINLLKNNHDERRAVLQMWDCEADLGRQGLDLPCNTQLYFKVREGKLLMTVCCRSNDILWGAYGANAVHMSMLQEYMAAMIGVPMGSYYQISDSWHCYTERWEQYGGFQFGDVFDPYHITVGLAKTTPLVSSPEAFDKDLLTWMEDPIRPNVYSNQFFGYVATPMFLAWQAYKQDRLNAAVIVLHNVPACDWTLGAIKWLNRIAEKRRLKAEGVAQ